MSALTLSHTRRGLYVALLGLAACSPAVDERPRLVVLYASCTVNKDYLAPYEPSVTFTPNLARFASDAVVFERHQTETGQSGPAFASIFTGVQADRHGIYNHPTWLVDDVYTIDEAFRDRGYDTHFWNKHLAASPRLNFGQGVEEANVKSPNDYNAFAREHLAGVLARLKEDPTYRAFVKLNFTVTHSPYHNRADLSQIHAFLAAHPDEQRGVTDDELRHFHKLFLDNHLALQWSFPETVETLGLNESEVEKLADVLELIYKTSVHELDRLFGEFVDAIRAAELLDESLIAFTADHGEILYRENALFKWTHGGQLAPEVLNVPWIVRAPGVPPGRYAAVTRSIDVFPTLAGLAREPLPPGTVDGVDLSASIAGDETPPTLIAFSHTCVVNPVALQQVQQWPLLREVSPGADVRLVWAAARDADMVYKLARFGGDEWTLQVFDLAEDPGEARDLYDGGPAQQTMLEALRGYKARLTDQHAYHAETNERQQELDAKRKARILRDLGYIR